MSSPAITAYCEAHLPATLDLLREMVSINSFTTNPRGVNRLGELTAKLFRPLGFTPHFIDPENDAHGRHLLLRRSGHSASPSVALISHLDTVFSEEEEARHEFAWRPRGGRIHGPGTCDIKGGTALIHLTLGAIRAGWPNVFDEANWIIGFNSCEEVASNDFTQICHRELPANTRACLVFEGDGDTADGCALVVGRKGRATFSIEAEGRAAHAGSQHRRGINAIAQLAQVVTEIDRLTDHAAGVTVNVGTFHGGSVINRVPHFARAELEMRAFSPEAYAKTRDRILALGGSGSVRSVDDAQACRVKVRLETETHPWPTNPRTDALLRLWQEAGRGLGIEVRSETRGGLSDGNHLWDRFPTLDGLGPRGDFAHCSEHAEDGTKQQEFVDATSFVPKAVLNATAIARLLAMRETEPNQESE